MKALRILAFTIAATALFTLGFSVHGVAADVTKKIDKKVHDSAGATAEKPPHKNTDAAVIKKFQASIDEGIEMSMKQHFMPILGLHKIGESFDSIVSTGQKDIYTTHKSGKDQHYIVTLPESVLEKTKEIELSWIDGHGLKVIPISSDGKAIENGAYFDLDLKEILSGKQSGGTSIGDFGKGKQPDAKTTEIGVKKPKQPAS